MLIMREVRSDARMNGAGARVPCTYRIDRALLARAPAADHHTRPRALLPFYYKMKDRASIYHILTGLFEAPHLKDPFILIKLRKPFR